MFFLSTHANRHGVDISFTVCLCVCLFVCVVTDFSSEEKASGVTFCTVVHRHPRQGISHFVNFAPQEVQNRTNRQARGPRLKPPHTLYLKASFFNAKLIFELYFSISFLGRTFDRVDLIKPVSNVRPSALPFVRWLFGHFGRRVDN